MKNNLILVLKGMCMGAADVVPGVSGGTMALILGIYQRLIYAIKSFDLAWLISVVTLNFRTMFQRPHFPFLIPLGIGIFLSLMFFTRVIPLPVLIRTHPELIYGFFFGLIAGSIYVLLREFRYYHLRDWLALIAGTIVGLVVFNLVPAKTPDSTWFIFLSGAVAICAMILPGISGSFILLILKKYAYILNAIGYFQFSVIVPFALGAVTGLVLFSRVLSLLLYRYYRSTLVFIIGLLLASLWIIWPFQQRSYVTVRGKEYLISSSPVLPEAFTQVVMMSIVLSVTGLVLILLINHIAGHDKP